MMKLVTSSERILNPSDASVSSHKASSHSFSLLQERALRKQRRANSVKHRDFDGTVSPVGLCPESSEIVSILPPLNKEPNNLVLQAIQVQRQILPCLVHINVTGIGWGVGMGCNGC